MPKTTTPKGITATPVKCEARNDIPQFFRLNVEVGDLDGAIAFYTDLLGVRGRKQPGHRCYFECGPVTLQVVDVSSNGRPHPAAKALYFTVEHLEAAFDRAKTLSCLSREDVHDAPAGGIVVRPWGERSFYAEDRGEIPGVSWKRELFTRDSELTSSTWLL